MADFIPKQYKKEQITIRIGFEKLDNIDRLAETYNLSRNEFINQCIDYAVKHMPPFERGPDGKMPPNA